MFSSFLLDDGKQDVATTDTYSKDIMELLHIIKALLTKKSNIWENTYGCIEQNICATALYLLSILSHAYNIVIGFGFGSHGHGKDVVDGLNATDKIFITMLMKIMQLPVAATNDSHCSYIPQ